MKQLTDEVFTQVRKALLEATLYVEEEGSVEHSKDHQDAIATLDTAQPEPLDKDTIAEIAHRMEAGDYNDSFWVEFTRAIEAAHGIKQGGQHE